MLVHFCSPAAFFILNLFDNGGIEQVYSSVRVHKRIVRLPLRSCCAAHRKASIKTVFTAFAQVLRGQTPCRAVFYNTFFFKFAVQEQEADRKSPFIF